MARHEGGNPVETTPQPIRGYYVRLLDDYLELLKNTKVTAEGDLVRTESTVELPVLRNALQLLAAARSLEAQHGEPSSEEGADSSKATNVLTAQQIVFRSVDGQEVKVVGGDGQTVQLVMKESDAPTRKKHVAGKIVRATGELDHREAPRAVRKVGTVEGSMTDESFLRIDASGRLQVLP